MKRLTRSIWLVFILCLLTGLWGCKSSRSATDFSHSGDGIYERPEEKPDHGHDNGVSSKERRRIVKEACDWIGTPYQYACQEKGVATDCSGLVMVVFDQVAGLKIPRNSAKQAEFCFPITQDEVKEGDLVFFATGKDPTKVSHVGIMINSLEFVHASSSKGVVISRMDNNYYRNHFLMYGRVPRQQATK